MTKRDAIIRAAIHEFGENSYSSASVNKIIRESKTSKGTFYHYFRGKKDLYITIIEESMEVKQEYLTRMIDQIKNTGPDFFTLLKAHAKAGTRFMLENPDLYKFGIQFAKDGSLMRDELEKKYLPEVGRSFEKVVRAGFEGRQRPADFPMDFAARIISYTMTHYYEILFDEDETPALWEIERRLNFLFELLRKGFS